MDGFWIWVKGVGRCAHSVFLAFSLACSQGLLDPEFGESPFANCRDDAGIRICLEKTKYSRVELVPFTIANSQDRTVFEDMCTGGVEGRPSEGGEWGGRHGVGRLCANYATRSDILAHMRYLPRGELVYDTFHVNSQALAGDWRIWIRVLNSDGRPLRDEFFVSPVFQVR